MVILRRRIREKPAQTATNAWADAVGVLRTTLTLRGRRGWPDEVYWLPGAPLLIEFKAPDEEPRKLQLYIHQQLRERGYDVQVHTEAAEAIAAIKARLAGNTKPGLEAGKVPVKRRAVST